MNATLTVGIISAVSALVVAVVAYTFNRRRDRELEWRKLKLERYQEYIASLSGIVGRRSTPEGQGRYSDAFNGLVLVAPASVLKLLYAFNEETRMGNLGRSSEAYEKFQNALLRELRRDVHPGLDDQTLKFFLIDAEPVRLKAPLLPDNPGRE
jgi:hypothetical protein